MCVKFCVLIRGLHHTFKKANYFPLFLIKSLDKFTHQYGILIILAPYTSLSLIFYP